MQKHPLCIAFLLVNRVQDNDDLAPLFNQYNDILKQTYGDFFVAELIESQDENNKALVAEVNFINKKGNTNNKKRNIFECFLVSWLCDWFYEYFERDQYRCIE